MAWYERIEGNVNRVMDALESREKRRREERRAARKRAAMFASPMRRMSALLIDATVIYIVMGTVFSTLSAMAPPLNLPEISHFLSESLAGLKDGRYNFGMVWQEGMQRGYIQRFLVNQLLQIFLLAIAVVPPLWRWQCTLGMRLTSLRLLKTDRRGKPGFLRCLWFFTAGLLTLMTGYITMIFTPQRRALHDMLSGTAVVRRKEIKEREAQEAMIAADAAAEAEILAQAEAKAAALGDETASKDSHPE